MKCSIIQKGYYLISAKSHMQFYYYFLSSIYVRTQTLSKLFIFNLKIHWHSPTNETQNLPKTPNFNLLKTQLRNHTFVLQMSPDPSFQNTDLWFETRLSDNADFLTKKERQNKNTAICVIKISGLPVFLSSTSHHRAVAVPFW